MYPKNPWHPYNTLCYESQYFVDPTPFHASEYFVDSNIQRVLPALVKAPKGTPFNAELSREKAEQICAGLSVLQELEDDAIASNCQLEASSRCVLIKG